TEEMSAAAEAAIVERDWNRAAALLESVLLKTHRPSPRLFRHLSSALRHLDRFQEAEEIIRAGLQEHKDDISLLSEWAEIPYSQKQWRETLKRWETISKAVPGKVSAVGYLRQARAHRNLGEYELAEQRAMEGLSVF